MGINVFNCDKTIDNKKYMAYCELIDYLKGIHFIEHYLEIIKEYGVDNWADKR